MTAICEQSIHQARPTVNKDLSILASGGFKGGRAGSVPPPLGDGMTPSLTVLLICDIGTVLHVWRHRRHFYLFKHVKHGTQNK